jgi:hypothetical protein
LLLAELGAQDGVVELDQDLALAHDLALLGVDRHGGQAAGLGADRHLFPGLDRARGVDGAGQGLGHDRRDAHRLAGGRRGLLGLVLGLVAMIAGGDAQGAEAEHQGQRSRTQAALVCPLMHDVLSSDDLNSHSLLAEKRRSPD